MRPRRLAGVLVLFTCVAALAVRSAPEGHAVVKGAVADPVIAAAGNIACDPTNPAFMGGLGTSTACNMKAVSNLLLDADGVTPRYGTVLALGDTQYTCGGLAAYHRSYGPTWGRVYRVTRPVVGDKDYRTTANAPGSTGCTDPPGRAAGFFSYFNGSPGIQQGPTPGSGAYYSFNVPSGCTPDGINPCWHLIALNGNCLKAPGCVPGTAQYTWLAADLAAHPNSTYGCTLAFWHQPRFSSGVHGSDAAYDAVWRLLYASGVDVVLNAHEHVYERFARQNPSGKPDLQGIREFIVGTGGASHVKFPSQKRLPTSMISNDATFGVLTLTLHVNGYDWRFRPEAGQSFTDASLSPTPCH
jgi:acid phosphatase type 7